MVVTPASFMSKEIIINVEKGQTRIALIEEGELAELYIENEENERTLGDIYLGRVRRTMPSIQAAFIDIGQKQDAFLHYSDLADNLPEWLQLLQSDKPQVSRFVASKTAVPADSIRKPVDARQDKKEDETPKGESSNEQENESSKSSSSSEKESRKRGQNGSNNRRKGRNNRKSNRSDSQGSRDGQTPPPETFLEKGKPILVKIVKEPISAKGSRVSTDISLAGRFLVLVPLANYVAVSKKIYSFKERRRLRALARSLLPTGFGVIVRTVAEGKKAKELDTDLRLLIDKWKKIEKKLEGSPSPPCVVHVDANMASSVIRDLFSDDYDRILIDDEKLFRSVKNYVQAVAPHMVPAVQRHGGKRPVFKEAKIAHEVAQAFESRVDLPSGGYLFIEHTEAMHVVDVNSGRAGRGLSQEENSLKVDLEAVNAIAKQIRLRDLGGIIVIDFIDLRDDRNRKKVYHELRKAFRRDRAVTKILPMSDFGLVEITRQRLRPSITKTFSNAGKTSKSQKNGNKSIEKKERRARTTTIEGFVEKIERWITSYKKKGKRRTLELQVHPFAAAYLTQRIPTHTLRWFLKYFIRVRLKLDESLDPLGFRFVDPVTGEDFSKRSGARQDRRRNRNPRPPKPTPSDKKEMESENASSEKPSSSRRSSRNSSQKGRSQRSKNQQRRSQQQRKRPPRDKSKNENAASNAPASEEGAPRDQPRPEQKRSKNRSRGNNRRNNSQRRNQRRNSGGNKGSTNDSDSQNPASEAPKGENKSDGK